MKVHSFARNELSDPVTTIGEIEKQSDDDQIEMDSLASIDCDVIDSHGPCVISDHIRRSLPVEVSGEDSITTRQLQ